MFVLSLKAHYYVESLLGYKHDAIKSLYRIILIHRNVNITFKYILIIHLDNKKQEVRTLHLQDHKYEVKYEGNHSFRSIGQKPQNLLNHNNR